MDFIDEIVEFIGKGLTINVSHIIIQMLATLILFFVVRKYLWKPITNLIESRREIINKELNEAKEKNLEAARLENLTREEYLKTKEESKAIIDKAIKEANLIKEDLINDAKKEAKRRLEKADLDIEATIEDSKEDIKKTIVDIAFQTAEKIIQREVSKETHQDLIDSIIEELVI